MDLMELTAVVRPATHGLVASCPELGVEARGTSLDGALRRLKEAVADRLAEGDGTPAYFTRYEMA